MNTKQMRAILIDPTEKTITEVEHDGSLDSLYRLVGAKPIDIRPCGTNVVLVIDDEGLFKEDQRFFSILGAPDFIFAGKALLMGNSDFGEAIDLPAFVTTLKAAALTIWRDVEFSHIETTQEDDVELPFGLGRGFSIRQEPKFRAKDGA